MESLLNSSVFIVSLVLASYVVGNYIYRKLRVSLLNPVLLAIIIVIAVLYVLGIDYQTFDNGSEVIDFMLGPSVVAIGYLLYEQLDALQGKFLSIATSVSVGAFVGVASVVLICRLLGCDDIITHSLEPKSVTTPIALSLSERLGGIPSIAAISVVLTGISGSVMGPSVLKLVGIKSKTAKGLALGCGAHGMGTARAIEMGAIEGAVSGLAIGLMGVATSLAMPVVEMLLG